MQGRIGYLLIPIAFILIAVTLYHPGFDAPMYLDSVERLQDKTSVFENKALIDVLRIFPPRPVAMLSFYHNFLLTGMNPYYFRLFNSLLLAATSFVAFLLFVVVLELPKLNVPAGAAERRAVALIAALLFLVHPLQIYVVLYIIQRMALLACFFYVCSLLMYLATRAGIFPGKALGYTAVIVCAVCAVLSKQNAITLPVVLLVAELAFFRSGPRELVRPVLLSVAMLASALIVLTILERAPGTEREADLLTTISMNYQLAGLTFKEMALSQCRITFHYLYHIIIPFPSVVPLMNPMVISKSIWSPPVTWVAVLGLAALAGAALLLVRHRPVAGFGLLFFVIDLIPESVSAPLHLFFPQRAHLPMIGVLLAAADGALLLLEQARTRGILNSARLSLGIFSIVWIALAGWTTFSAAQLWRNPIEVWQRVVDGFPAQQENVEIWSRVNALNGLAKAFENANRVSEAIEAYEKSAQIVPHYEVTLLNLGRAYLITGQVNEAESSLNRLLRVNPNHAQAHSNLGWLLMRHYGKTEEAARHFEIALQFNPALWQAHLNLGDLLQKSGKPKEAEIHYREALRIVPNNRTVLERLKTR